MTMSPKISALSAICWDYDIDATSVYKILTTKNDVDSPVSYDTLRYKILKYLPVDDLKKAFSMEEIKNIFSDINVKRIRNSKTKYFIETL
ncbi:hypothetical protein [Arcobacter sp.]|uniref:hypothetical protein n=1 Tax=Arcobacter sp. TaxID=1872629 RepID=UPI003D09A841